LKLLALFCGNVDKLTIDLETEFFRKCLFCLKIELVIIIMTLLKHFCVYNDLFEGCVSVQEVFDTPYPVYRDIILTQIKRKKKQNDLLKKQQANSQRPQK